MVTMNTMPGPDVEVEQLLRRAEEQLLPQMEVEGHDQPGDRQDDEGDQPEQVDAALDQRKRWISWE